MAVLLTIRGRGRELLAVRGGGGAERGRDVIRRCGKRSRGGGGRRGGGGNERGRVRVVSHRRPCVVEPDRGRRGVLRHRELLGLLGVEVLEVRRRRRRLLSRVRRRLWLRLMREERHRRAHRGHKRRSGHREVVFSRRGRRSQPVVRGMGGSGEDEVGMRVEVRRGRRELGGEVRGRCGSCFFRRSSASSCGRFGLFPFPPGFPHLLELCSSRKESVWFDHERGERERESENARPGVAFGPCFCIVRCELR